MKKLLIVLFLAGFVGLAFAFSPSKVLSSKEINQTSLYGDSTKTKKKATKSKTCKQECCSKSTKECGKSCKTDPPKK